MRRVAPLVLVAIIMASLLSPVLAIASPSGTATSRWSRTCSVYIVAVSSSGGGVTGNLTVTVVYPGHGRVYISTSPASMIDTQGSARLAAFSASLLAGVDMTRLDFYYDVESGSIIIGGPSAGFAMALATLLALEGVNCTRDFAVTGMIQPDTSIGPVGGLKEKLEAAAHAGAKLFIIPAGQEVYKYYKTVYKRIGPLVIAERVPVQVNLTSYGEKLGVRVETAASLDEGYRLVTGKTLLTANVSKPKIDPRIQALIKQYLAHVNTTLIELNTTISQAKNKYVENLYDNATKTLEEAANLYSQTHYYQAALKAVESLETAYTASYLAYAIGHNLDITVPVEEVNATLQHLYNKLNDTNYDNLSPVGVESLEKAWAKTGISAYYYQKALQALESEDGKYKLPSFLGRIDTTGAEYLAESRALASWSWFWLNASTLYPGKTSPDRVRQVALVLLAEARTAVAYLDTLLNEAGAPTTGEELPIYLTTEAMSTSNPVGKLGLSIEAIALSTSIIHETFTLQPARTARELVRTAETIASRINNTSLQEKLLVSYALSINSTRDQLLSASKAVLYAYTTQLLLQEKVKPQKPVSPRPTTSTPTVATNKTASNQPGKTAANTTAPGVARPQYSLTIALIAIITLIIGVIVGALIPRSGQY
ncbi:MAG: hypothetical protein F7C33_05860 [Desulfurococcales archaeon]|nr:hypothetical protein [Desulfurococcales archaeon]